MLLQRLQHLPRAPEMTINVYHANEKCNLKESFNLLCQKDSKNISEPIRFSILKKTGSIMQLFGTCLKYITPPQTSASSSLPRQMYLVVQGLQGQLPSQ